MWASPPAHYDGYGYLEYALPGRVSWADQMPTSSERTIEFVCSPNNPDGLYKTKQLPGTLPGKPSSQWHRVAQDKQGQVSCRSLPAWAAAASRQPHCKGSHGQVPACLLSVSPSPEHWASGPGPAAQPQQLAWRPPLHALIWFSCSTGICKCRCSRHP